MSLEFEFEEHFFGHYTNDTMMMFIHERMIAGGGAVQVALFGEEAEKEHTTRRFLRGDEYATKGDEYAYTVKVIPRLVSWHDRSSFVASLFDMITIMSQRQTACT